MGKKKMKLPFLFKNNSIQARSTSWPWPPCQQTRTLSFRADETPFEPVDDPVETVIQGLVRSERLFFDPGETSSILEEAKTTSDDNDIAPFRKSVVMSMESRDPFADFRNSMGEIVEAQGLKDWENLDELLCWYLKANAKDSHGYIVAAFVDLLVELTLISYSTDNNCVRSQSPLSFYTSASSSSSSCSSSSNSSATTPCVSSLSDQKEITEDNKDDVSSSSLSHGV
ncbi:putative Ovate family protein [Hibiscus syriacus]|uniref:Transcription repressor n=1 Tax=Hibiscus syriacus TaxID=106335 RepID=A0A6A3BRA6_HIBSY|nr:transcription repressor OFP15-like [Hibiscus syriacus]KAE8718985.1 putative Ovate family protein [Hibiscus syriacus]